jgi:ribosomal protein S18 acetylase RimI-like enzyme
MEFNIIHFTEAHTDQLRGVYLSGRNHAFPRISNTYELHDFDRDTEGEKILIAVAGQVSVGFVSWWEPDNFIHCLYVLPDFHRFGIGKSLLLACLERIGRPARLKCVRDNEPAMQFYQSLGWSTVETGESPEGMYALMQYNP